MAILIVRKTLSTVLVGLASLGAWAADKYQPLPPALDGSMMPYDFAACTQPPYLPDSLTPVYSSYVARHGSRFLSSPEKVKPVMDALIKGRNSGTLSATGEDFLTLMNSIIAVNTDNWGDLSPLGISEERRLGQRMFDIMQPRLAEKGAAVSAVSTFVPRAVMTMYQFTNELIRINDNLTIKTDEGRQYSDLLYYFAANPIYKEYRKHGNWKEVYDKFVKENVPTGPAQRLFTTTDMTDHELRKLTLDMYEVLKANRAAGLPAPTTQWMSTREYTECWRASNLQHYLRNSITPLSNIAGEAVAPLLQRLIDDTDEAVADFSVGRQHNRLNAYFGHAETLLPLLSLIHLPNCNRLKLGYDDIGDCWKVQELTPLAANLLVLLAESPSGHYYAVIQLNGRTVNPVPGEPDIVSWNRLRDYWQQCLQSVSNSSTNQ